MKILFKMGEDLVSDLEGIPNLSKTTADIVRDIIERTKTKSAAEIKRISQFQDLQNTAIKSRKFTFSWFKSLLNIQKQNYQFASSNSS